jgi:hypothetical protein
MVRFSFVNRVWNDKKIIKQRPPKRKRKVRLIKKNSLQQKKKSPRKDNKKRNEVNLRSIFLTVRSWVNQPYSMCIMVLSIVLFIILCFTISNHYKLNALLHHLA